MSGLERIFAERNSAALPLLVIAWQTRVLSHYLLLRETHELSVLQRSPSIYPPYAPWAIDDLARTHAHVHSAVIDGFHPYEISGSAVRIYCEQFDRFYLVLFMINPQWYPRDIPETPKKPPMSRYVTLLLPSVSILADMYINTLARSLARRTLSINTRGDDKSRKKRDFLARNVASRWAWVPFVSAIRVN